MDAAHASHLKRARGCVYNPKGPSFCRATITGGGSIRPIHAIRYIIGGFQKLQTRGARRRLPSDHCTFMIIVVCVFASL